MTRTELQRMLEFMSMFPGETREFTIIRHQTGIGEVIKIRYKNVVCEITDYTCW